MAYENLNRYVKEQNQWGKIFSSHTDIVLPRDADRVFGMLECALSPENLTCDGELPRAEVKRRHQYLTACLDELSLLTGKNYDPVY